MTDVIRIVQPGPLSATARGLRARLEAVFPPAQFGHEWMPGRVTPAVWSRITRRAPLVAIGFTGFSPQAMGHADGRSSWTVYLATRNEAGDAARLFGDRLAPGLFGLIEVAVGALQGHQIADGGTVDVDSVAHAFVDGFDGDIALGVVEVTIPTVIDLRDLLAGGDADPGLGNTADIEWNFAGPDGAAGTHTGEA